MNPFGHSTALIGHTGFVGSHLAAAAEWTDTYNSRNISEIAGKEYDTVVCAGVQAVKYWANQHPAEDMEGIQRLLEPLKEVRATRFILLSTIDVFPVPFRVTEDDAPGDAGHAYGRNRLYVESSISNQLSQSHIVRLPGLFGAGIKKNIIYDLLHDNCLEMIQPASLAQYYNLENLAGDLVKIVQADLRLVHLATEPMLSAEIIDRCAPGKEVGSKAGAPGKYGFMTKHCGLWGRSDGYIQDKERTLAEIERFMNREREHRKS